MTEEIPGKITQKERVSNKSGKTDYTIGTVEFEDGCEPVDLDLVPDAGIGDLVLVRSGFAIRQINASEANILLLELKRLRALPHH